MEISTIADWFGLIGGIALGVTWIWKIQAWFRANIAKTKEGAEMGGVLARELLNSATGTAKRSDIYAYIQFFSAEMEFYYVRNFMYLLAVVGGLLFLGLFIMFSMKILATDSPWFWFVVSSFSSSVVATIVFAFFVFQMRQLQLGWLNEVHRILHERAIRHLPEA